MTEEVKQEVEKLIKEHNFNKQDHKRTINEDREIEYCSKISCRLVE